MNLALLALKGAISELPKADQEKIFKTAEAIRKAVTECGELGVCALGFVSAELAEEEEKKGKR